MVDEVFNSEKEQRAYEKGIVQGIVKNKLENVKGLLELLDDDQIAHALGLEKESVKQIRIEKSKEK